MGTGIPIVNDPLTRFYNPLVFIPVLILPFVSAIKTVFFLCILLSGIFFLILSRYLKIEKLFGLLLSLTYMSSGFLIGRIVGGHFEWILAYPLIPLFYLVLLILLDKKNILWAGILSLIISLFILSGNIYVGFYSSMILLLIILFLIFKLFLKRAQIKGIVKQIFYLASCFVLFPLFTALKIIPVFELFQSATNNRNFDPFLGSQNIFSLVYNFFLPSQTLFKYLNLTSFIATPYYWWESFAYIGPFFVVGALIFFIFWSDMKKTTTLYLFAYLTVIFLLFSMLASPLSPFHWLFLALPILNVFRVPSRIFIFLIPLVLIFSYFGLEPIYQASKKKTLKAIIILLMILNLVSVYYIFNSSYTKGFPLVNENYNALLDYLKQNDTSYYYIAQSVFFENQLPLYQTIENHQLVMDTSHDWEIKGSPEENYFYPDFDGSEVYRDIYPKYFLYPQGYSPPATFNAKIIRTEGNAYLYKDSLYTPYAYIANSANEIMLSDKDNANVKSIKIGVDRIDVEAYSPNNNSKLIVVESYSSGWTSTVDGRKTTILNERFLTVNAKKGLHEYSFMFSSVTFKLGLIISFLSILAWLLIISIYFYKARTLKNKTIKISQ
jgi:hypothetical protein